MMVFSQAGLALLSVPKTGSTALQIAMQPMADIVFAKYRKHIPAQRFHQKVRPWLAEAFDIKVEAVGVMREPVDQLRSWYRYRSRRELAGSALSTAGCSFDEFVTQVLSDTPAPFADLGSQWRFLTGSRGRLLVPHLFAWERPSLFLSFFEDRLESRFSIKRQNVSPYVPADLSPAIEARLRAKRSADFDLYDKVAAQGYLHTPL